MVRAPKEKTAKAKVTTTIRMPIKIMARAEGDLTQVPVTFVVRQVIVKRSASRNKTKAKEKTTKEAKAKMERASPKAKQEKEKVQRSTPWRKPVLTNRVQKRKLQVLIGWAEGDLTQNRPAEDWILSPILDAASENIPQAAASSSSQIPLLGPPVSSGTQGASGSSSTGGIFDPVGLYNYDPVRGVWPAPPGAWTTSHQAYPQPSDQIAFRQAIRRAMGLPPEPAAGNRARVEAYL